MTKLYKKNAVLHSLIWLFLYLGISTVAGNIATGSESEFSAIAAVPVFLLALACFVYLQRSGISKEIGLLTKPTEKALPMLLYIPLFVLPAYSLINGFNTELTPFQVLSALLHYAGVGFMEEIIFRGLMFKGLTAKWNRVLTVAFISLTFGMGHIISVAAIGMSGPDVIIQIVNATVVGFMFTTVILASENLTACVIAHIAFNFLVGVCAPNDDEWLRVGFNSAVTLVYFVYLFFGRGNVRAYF